MSSAGQAADLAVLATNTAGWLEQVGGDRLESLDKRIAELEHLTRPQQPAADPVIELMKTQEVRQLLSGKDELTQAKFVLDADSLAQLQKAQPVEIKKLEPTKLRAVIDSRGDLHILSDAEWRHWSEANDEEELLILLALKYFDDDYV